MDRSEISPIRHQSLKLLLLLKLLFPVAVFAQEAAAPPPAKPAANEENPFAEMDETTKARPQEEEPVATPTPTPTPKNKPELLAGILYGHLAYVSEDPKRLGVIILPLNEDQVRQSFVVDEKTEFKIDGKKAKLADIHVGQKVALRYFSENRIAIAEAIFVEHGDFRPEQYIHKKKGAGGGGKAKKE